MPEGGVAFNLDELKDALPKFRTAVEDIRQVASTVDSATKGLGKAQAGSRSLSSSSYGNQLEFLTDRLQKAIEDYEEVLIAPVEGGPGGGPWKPKPDDGKPGGDDDDETKWPDGKPGKGPGSGKGNNDNDDDDDDDDDSQTTFPGSSGASNGSNNGNPQNDGTPGNDQSGSPGQSGSQGSQSGPGSSGSSHGHNQDDETNAAGIPVVGLTGAGQSGKKDDEEDEEEEDDLNIPEYVSAVNRPVVDELIEKHQELEDTQNRLTELEGARTEKAAVLERLQAAALNSDDPSLLDRIDQLKKEITDIDTEMYYANEKLPGLQEEVDALQQRVDLISLSPDADLDAIRKLEGGETSQWIRDATHNEDNSVNCVNYIVNRMAIPGELPLNAHLWDEQAIKFADKYGIKVGTVPLEGSVIVMEREHSYANDIYGHVMYVEKVEDGIVWVTDNNYPDKLVRLDHLTTELSGPYIKYLYFPWQAKI